MAKFPYLPTLLASIQTAVPRPVTPFYPAVTEAIETNVYAALQGQVSHAERAVQPAVGDPVRHRRLSRAADTEQVTKSTGEAASQTLRPVSPATASL